MLCDSCADYQEQLLDSGDGSQVICEHQLIIDEKADTSNATAVPTAAAGETTSRKRKFVTADQFAKLADVKLRRKLAPVKKWRELAERIPCRAVQIHSMEVNVIKGKKKQKSYYAELENEEEEMINVWITDIIQNELAKHNLNEGNVYIMPLGKTTTKNTGREYYNFAIVQDD